MVSEEQFLAVVEGLLGPLVGKFKIPGYDSDDLKQFCRLEAVKLMGTGKYDEGRPLDKYLYRHLHNRLINLHRDLVWRPGSSCRMCETGSYCCENGPCKAHLDYLARNSLKSNIIGAGSVECLPGFDVPEAGDDSTFDDASHRDLIEMIEKYLPAHLLEEFRLLLEGKPAIRSDRRSDVRKYVREMLEAEGLDLSFLDFRRPKRAAS